MFTWVGWNLFSLGTRDCSYDGLSGFGQVFIVFFLATSSFVASGLGRHQKIPLHAKKKKKPELPSVKSRLWEVEHINTDGVINFFLLTYADVTFYFSFDDASSITDLTGFEQLVMKSMMQPRCNFRESWLCRVFTKQFLRLLNRNVIFWGILY